MGDHDSSKTYAQLLHENELLKQQLDSLRTLAQKPDNNLNAVKRQGTLNNYLDNLALQPLSDLYANITQSVAGVFDLRAALFFLFNESETELELRHTHYTPGIKPVFEQIPCRDNTTLKFKLNQSNIDYLRTEPYRLERSFNNLLPGAIPEHFGNALTQQLNLSWFVALTLSYKENLIGILALMGSPENQVPEDDKLSLFTVLTTSTIARKVAEESLAISESRFRLLFDEAPVGYQSLDINGNIKDVNQAWLSLLGYNRNEVIGRYFGDFIAEKSKPYFKDSFGRFKADGQIHCELNMVHKSTKVLNIDLEGRIGLDTDGIFRQTHCILKDITLQRQAEQLIRKREERFEAIANYTANWEIWLDSDGKVIWTNPAAESFTGYTPDEILETADLLTVIVAPEHQETVASILGNPKKEAAVRTFEIRCIRKNQTSFRAEFSWTEIFDKSGNYLGIRLSGHDVTLYRAAEKAIKENERLYRQMVDNAPFGMHFYELNHENDLIFTGANAIADKILGISHKQFIGKPIAQVFPSLGPEIIDAYRESARKNVIWETDQIIYTDQRISGAFEVKAFQTVPEKMVAMFTDITKRKQAEEQLFESRELFEALARVSPVGIFRTDEQGETTYVNPKWSSLTGLKFEDALESRYLSAIHPDDREARLNEWRDAVVHGQPVVSEYRFLHPDGKVVWVQGHAVPEIVNGKIKGYIGTITDISDLKAAGIELLRAKERAEASDKLKATFMGNISHEIRTPLNGIIGFADLIASGGNTFKENEEYIELLSQSINRLTRIIDNIMDVSIMMSGNKSLNKEPFDLDKLCTDIFLKYEFAAQQKSLAFTLNRFSPSSTPLINSDKGLIERILTELTDNAIKFTHTGSVHLECGISAQTLHIQVTDTGIGISPELLPFVFEPFMQEDVYAARYKNSNGLGLAIVNEAVMLLGGKIHVDSSAGQGTRFLVTIPVLADELPAADADKIVAPAVVKKATRILVVEDEEVNLSYLTRVLKSHGIEVQVSKNGSEAVAFIEQGNQTDLVLMDIRMPDMDGFEATRLLKKMRPALKIAAVTAYAGEGEKQACFDAGCDDYIAKPFQKKDLFKMLKRMGIGD